MYIEQLKARLHHEYWPWWLFYLPMVPMWLFWAIKTRSLTWFTATNTNIPDGGFFGESKWQILQHIPEPYRPKACLIQPTDTLEEIEQRIRTTAFHFPVVVKPDVGERGNGVQKIDDPEALLQALKTSSRAMIIQEYIHYAVELGVFYIKMPGNEKGAVTSLTGKEFLQVTGDGILPVELLLYNELRGKKQIARLKNDKSLDLKHIPLKGEVVNVEPIGNHCRGTKFINANHLINEQLNQVFNTISNALVGFHFGRFDIKVPSIEALYAGENIKIMELNGASSEPGHIYDPEYNLFKAYRDLAWHWHQLGRIAYLNLKQDKPSTSLRQMLHITLQHFSDSKKQHDLSAHDNRRSKTQLTRPPEVHI